VKGQKGIKIKEDLSEEKDYFYEKTLPEAAKQGLSP
jgi:hypothetical protein